MDVYPMLGSFPLGELKQLVHLYLSWYHKRKGKIARARRRLNMALASTSRPAPFIFAFDGLLMIGEDRLRSAQARFAECLAITKPEGSVDDDFVAKYCKLWLSIYDEAVGYDEIKTAAEKKNAAWSKASRLLQILLPRSPMDELKEICGHREPRGTNDWTPKAPSSEHRTSIAFDF